MKKCLLVLTLCTFVLILTGCHKHTYRPATCTTPPTCEECGETEGSSLGHNYSNPTCETPPTCARCGETMGAALGHTWVDATCDKAKICSVCGTEEGSPNGHNYSDPTCTEAAICIVCGEKGEDALGHNYVAGSCTEDIKCTRCDDTIPAPGHNFTDATCTEPKKCMVCNETEGDPLGHILEDGQCTRCGLDIGSIDSIRSIAGLKAKCESDYAYCVVDADCDPATGNPYDVDYDYGQAYESFVENCDWSLIYDHDYYAKTYPILATLYHKDKRLLLRHFQTVGIHEGRQANSSFNVSAYMDNCSDNIKDSLGSDYAAYAIYYMLNYSTEKNIEHLKLANGKTPAKQSKVILTVMQAKELLEINNYRADVNAHDLTIDAELCAYANYRAWMNAHDDWAAHDWAKKNNDMVWDLLGTMNAGSMAENTVTSHQKRSRGEAKYANYRNSKEHYDALIRTKYNYFGTSNFYNSINENLNNDEWLSKYVSSTFDCFTDKAKTAYNN